MQNEQRDLRFKYYNSCKPDKDYYAKKYIHLKGEQRYDYVNLIKQAGIMDGKKVLDTGCGTGDFLSYVKGKGTHCFGIDYSQPSIVVAHSSQYKYHHYCVSDVQCIPYNDNSFDLVFSSHLIEHLHEDELIRFFKEVRRILKPNGKFIAHTCPNKWYRYTVYRFYTRWVRMILYPALNLFLKNRISQIPSIDEFKRQASQRKENTLLHVNEKSPYGLKTSLKNAGFENPIVWCYGEPFVFKFWMLPVYIIELLYPLPKVFPAFFTNHIWAICTKGSANDEGWKMVCA